MAKNFHNFFKWIPEISDSFFHLPHEPKMPQTDFASESLKKNMIIYEANFRALFSRNSLLYPPHAKFLSILYDQNLALSAIRYFFATRYFASFRYF